MNRIYKCFPGGKFKVLTLSYDDGKLEDKRLVDIFNKNGIRATFNVRVNRYANQTACKRME
jgi:peptidoglycan/xylan/chitin deacetylase (PgdA/CDA1 family)